MNLGVFFGPSGVCDVQVPDPEEEQTPALGQEGGQLPPELCILDFHPFFSFLEVSVLRIPLLCHGLNYFKFLSVV